MSEITFDIRDPQGNPTVLLQGKLTLRSIDQLQRTCLKTLKEMTGQELVIDMAGVDYIDSLSMGRLVALNKFAVDNGKSLVLAKPRAMVSDAFRMLHMDKVVTVR